MMTNPPPAAPDPITMALVNLAAAGISFTEVARCPVATCVVCDRAALATAA